MKPFSTVLLLSISINLFPQYGTLIIATITPESIVIASDSRVVYYQTDDHSRPPLAYFDSIRKIYKLKQFIVGIVGATSIGTVYYDKVINDFNKISFHDTGLANTFRVFKSYLDKTYPLTSFPERISNKFIGAGYVNGKPGIISMNSYKILDSISIGTMFSEQGVEKYAQANLNKFTSLSNWLENIIYDYAKGENKIAKVGGAISIVQISKKNEVKFIKNDFSNRNYKSLTEFYELVKNNNIKFVCVSPNCRETLLQVMRH
jgi:hypothetical protein